MTSRQQRRQLAAAAAADAGFVGFDCGSGRRITWSRPNSGKPYLLHNNFNHRLSLNDVYSDSPFVPSLRSFLPPPVTARPTSGRRFSADLFGGKSRVSARPSVPLTNCLAKSIEASLFGRKTKVRHWIPQKKDSKEIFTVVDFCCCAVFYDCIVPKRRQSSASQTASIAASEASSAASGKRRARRMREHGDARRLLLLMPLRPSSSSS